MQRFQGIAQQILSVLWITALLMTGVFAGNTAVAQTEVAPPAQSGEGPQPVVVQQVGFEVTRPLAEIAAEAAPLVEIAPEDPRLAVAREQETLSIFDVQPLNVPDGPPDIDRAVQGSAGLAPTVAMPTPIYNFDGVNNINFVSPPDTQGDIGYDLSTGKRYYIQWVNLSFAIWDVTGGTPGSEDLLVGPLAGNALFSGATGDCAVANDGDPITLFDPVAQRWMMSQFAVNGPFYQCIAVSATADPLGVWYTYAYEWETAGGVPALNDYPKFGVWPDGYYMSVNQFIPVGLDYDWGGGGVAVFEREKMLQGLPAQMVVFDMGPSDWGGWMPSDLDGSRLPPTDAPNPFVQIVSNEWDTGFPNDEIRIHNFDVNWSNPNLSTFNRVATIPLTGGNAFDGSLCLTTTSYTRSCIPQPGTSNRLDAIGERIMYRAAYRNFASHQAIVTNLSVDADGSDRAGVRWFELRNTGSTWTLYQNSTFSPDGTNNRWMGSIAQDANGNIALGYNISSGTTYPSIAAAGRLAADPLNTLTQGETILFSGSASQTISQRWGDYSMMGIDPLDDCTFWFTGEYSSGGSAWRTRIIAFRYPTCAQPLGTLSGVARDGGGTPLAGVTVTATSTGLVPVSTQSASDGSFSLQVVPGTYTLTGTKFGYITQTVNGLVVNQNQTTTQNLTLNAASMYTVSGTVRDAQTNWPLYARITVPGTPVDVWSNPFTGTYSINLPAGNYTMNVEAFSGGYNGQTRSLVGISSNRTENFNLAPDLLTCLAPGYTASSTLLTTQHFESWPLTGGWTITDNEADGETCQWKDQTDFGGTSEANLTGASGNYADADSDDCGSAYFTNTTLTTPAINAASYDSLRMEFNFQYESFLNTDTGYIEGKDSGGVWSTVWERPPALSSSGRETIFVPAHSTSQIRFQYQADWEYWWQVDAIEIYGQDCTAPAGGLVAGFVTDANTGDGITGATVTGSAGSVLSQATPLDTALDNGLYFLYTPAGAQSISATAPGGYGTDSATPTVPAGGLVQSNLELPAGYLTFDPSSFTLTMMPGDTTQVSFVITNTGTLPANFSGLEIEGRFIPYQPDQTLMPAGRFSSPKSLNTKTSAGWYERRLIPSTPLAAGDVLQTINTGLIGGWGVAPSFDQANLWVSDSNTLIDDHTVYRYPAAGGASTGNFSISTAVGTFAADIAYNPFTQTFWQVDVGGDNCFFEWDPDTLALTGNKICPALGTSQRGLAFDPVSNTYFSGSWNDGVIHRIRSDGTVVESISTGLPVAGLAYNPSTGHLFVQVNELVTVGSTPSPDIYVLEPANNYAVLGSFIVNSYNTDYAQAGLEMRCDGNLLGYNQNANTILRIDSGESGACNWQDIPWATTSSLNGSLNAGQTATVTIDVDADGLGIGIHYGHIRFLSDTPYANVLVPVTLQIGRFNFLPTLSR